MATGDIVRLGADMTLIQYFSWTGNAFPFAGSQDLNISVNTVWDDTDNQIKQGYKKVKKLTIAAGVTLKINHSPFYLFVDEIAFGDTISCIDASGPNGASAGDFTNNFAKGGTAVSGSGRAQGGCGGGMLFVICRKLSGANGCIKANGGNGYKNTSAASQAFTASGQGCLSNTYLENAGVQGGTFPVEAWYSYRITNSGNLCRANLASILGYGGQKSNNYGGMGGGSGGANNGTVGGGSGLGGGGGAGANSESSSIIGGSVAIVTPSVADLFMLADLNCLGGGGGASRITTGSDSFHCAAGGGGGSVVCFVREALMTPALQANGGTGVKGNGDTAAVGNGGAGVTYLIAV